MIYNEEPIQVLWDLFKSLSADIKIYKETMNEDKDSTPDSYLLLRSDITDSPLVYGDGITLVRQSDCDVILVSKGAATQTTDLHNVNRAKVAAVLDGIEIAYSGHNLGYEDSINSTQYTWSFELNYFVKENDNGN